MRLFHFETLFLILFSLSSPLAFGNETVTSEVDPILSEVFSDASPENSSPIKKLTKTVEERAGILSERARKEIDKYRVRLTVNMLGDIFEDDNYETDGGVYYQMVVEPAFRDREQLRRDVWVIDLGAGSHFRASGALKLTFSRYFNGPNAKLDALTAYPYCPIDLIVCKRKTPLNSNEVKTLLKDKEGFRLEILGNIAVGMSRGVSNSNMAAGAFLRYKREGYFIMDLYKANALQTRTRFVGIKNAGELEGGVSLENPLSSLFSGALSFIKRKLKLGLWLSGRRSFNFFMDWEPKTLDTMMADYQFNFSNPNTLSDELLSNSEIAEYAMDEILRNIKKGGFSSLFLFFYKGDEVTSRLLQQAASAERISQIDLKRYRARLISPAEMRVVNHFKGKIVSFVRALDFGASAFDLVAGNGHGGAQSNYVTAYDVDHVPHYYRLENSFLKSRTRAFFGRNKYEFTNDLDVLMHSDSKQGVGDLTDIVVRTEIQETTLSKKEVKALKSTVLNIVPSKYHQNESLLATLEGNVKTNAFYSYRSSFSAEAFLSIQRLTKPELHMLLIDFFEKHPQRRYMNLPFDQSMDQPNYLSLSEYTERKAVEIIRLIEPNFAIPEENHTDISTPDLLRRARLRAFQIALVDPIFEQYLIPEFFPRLLPTETVDQMYSFDIKTSSFETKTRTAKVGQNTISRIYESVSFIRSIINDRSLNLQMTNSLDDLGNTILAPQQGSVLVSPQKAD